MSLTCIWYSYAPLVFSSCLYSPLKCEMTREHLSEFRQIINGELNDFVKAANALGELTSILAQKVKVAFDVLYSFILSGIQRSHPSQDAVLSSMMEPLSTIINDIQEFRNINRREENFFNHLSAVSESIVALSWIAAAAPARFVREMRDAGDYFGNRVLSANRSNQPHVLFIRSWGRVLTALENYVLHNHRTGFDWAAAVRAGYVPVDANVGGNVPPPPPPPPLQEPGAAAAAALPQPDRSALFQQINAQGENIAGMLRPSRARGPFVIAGAREVGRAEPEAIGEPAAHAIRPVRPERVPRFELEGRKWFVEFQRDNFALVIESGDMSQSISVFQCESIGLEVRNKINGISMDNTNRSTIAIQDIIAAVELIRCSNITIQCIGNVPTINLDRCDSVQIFLTGKAWGVEIITSNSTSINVCILAEDGTYVELPVPEQVRTIIRNGQLVSAALDRH